MLEVLWTGGLEIEIVLKIDPNCPNPICLVHILELFDKVDLEPAHFGIHFTVVAIDEVNGGGNTTKT